MQQVQANLGHRECQRVEEKMTVSEKEMARKTDTDVDFLRKLDERGLIHAPFKKGVEVHHLNSNFDLIVRCKQSLCDLEALELDLTTMLDIVRVHIIRDVLLWKHEEGGQLRKLTWRDPMLQDWMYLMNPNAKTSLAEAMIALVSEHIKRIDLVDVIKAKKLLMRGLAPIFVYRDDSMHVRTTVSFDIGDVEPSTSGMYKIHPALPYFKRISERLGVQHPFPSIVPKMLSITTTDIGLVESAHIEKGGRLQSINLGTA